jgi:hypothetical protein
MISQDRKNIINIILGQIEAIEASHDVEEKMQFVINAFHKYFKFNTVHDKEIMKMLGRQIFRAFGLAYNGSAAIEFVSAEERSSEILLRELDKLVQQQTIAEEDLYSVFTSFKTFRKKLPRGYQQNVTQEFVEFIINGEGSLMSPEQKIALVKIFEMNNYPAIQISNVNLIYTANVSGEKILGDFLEILHLSQETMPPVDIIDIFEHTIENLTQEQRTTVVELALGIDIITSNDSVRLLESIRIQQEAIDRIHDSYPHPSYSVLVNELDNLYADNNGNRIADTLLDVFNHPSNADIFLSSVDVTNFNDIVLNFENIYREKLSIQELEVIKTLKLSLSKRLELCNRLESNHFNELECDRILNDDEIEIRPHDRVAIIAECFKKNSLPEAGENRDLQISFINNFCVLGIQSRMSIDAKVIHERREEIIEQIARENSNNLGGLINLFDYPLVRTLPIERQRIMSDRAIRDIFPTILGNPRACFDLSNSRLIEVLPRDQKEMLSVQMIESIFPMTLENPRACFDLSNSRLIEILSPDQREMFSAQMIGSIFPMILNNQREYPNFPDSNLFKSAPIGMQKMLTDEMISKMRTTLYERSNNLDECADLLKSSIFSLLPEEERMHTIARILNFHSDKIQFYSIDHIPDVQVYNVGFSESAKTVYEMANELILNHNPDMSRTSKAALTILQNARGLAAKNFCQLSVKCSQIRTITELPAGFLNGSSQLFVSGALIEEEKADKKEKRKAKGTRKSRASKVDLEPELYDLD